MYWKYSLKTGNFLIYLLPLHKIEKRISMNKQNSENKPISILFVCLGNICRSPAAEGIMQHIVDSNDAGHLFRIDSAGIGPWHVGELPDRRMRSHGADHGYDFSTRARQICKTDFAEFDYIVVMDRENYYEVTGMAPTESDKDKVCMMTDFATSHPGHYVVPDPYYGGDKGFELVIELLEDACQGLFDSIMKKRK